MGLYWPNFSMVFLIRLFLYAGVYCTAQQRIKTVKRKRDYANRRKIHVQQITHPTDIFYPLEEYDEEDFQLRFRLF